MSFLSTITIPSIAAVVGGVISQGGAPVDWVNTGIMSAVLAWFMQRSEKKQERTIRELQRFGKVSLLFLYESDHVSEKTKHLAKELLEEYKQPMPTPTDEDSTSG